MTTLEAPAVDRPDGDRSEDRGITTISPAVYERLAARAAAEVPGVDGVVETGVSRLLPWTSGAPAEATADIADDAVVLDLTFNVAYPQPVRQISDRVREHVTDRVVSLTGCEVRSINITVPDLVVVAARRPRVR